MLDWGEQIVLITGGSSQSLFTLVFIELSRRSIWSWGVTRKHFGGPQCYGCRSRHKPHCHRELCVFCNEPTTTTTFVNLVSDNITYYKCDVSKLEEVEAVAKRVIKEVSYFPPRFHMIWTRFRRLAIPPC